MKKQKKKQIRSFLNILDFKMGLLSRWGMGVHDEDLVRQNAMVSDMVDRSREHLLAKDVEDRSQGFCLYNYFYNVRESVFAHPMYVC